MRVWTSQCGFTRPSSIYLILGIMRDIVPLFIPLGSYIHLCRSIQQFPSDTCGHLKEIERSRRLVLLLQLSCRFYVCHSVGRLIILLYGLNNEHVCQWLTTVPRLLSRYHVKKIWCYPNCLFFFFQSNLFFNLKSLQFWQRCFKSWLCTGSLLFRCILAPL